jgi:hypothetical protein
MDKKAKEEHHEGEGGGGGVVLRDYMINHWTKKQENSKWVDYLSC